MTLLFWFLVLFICVHFIDAFNQLLPPSLDLYYVDDWDTYHLMQGEVHCGSNTRRSPPNVTWWKDAAHLMGGL